ncbi:MAG: glycosyltransferase family 52 [Psychroserpens sp.]|uniref:glycosyltransferase family 52 n=1 Tax=Psychroserpens sp. TaxID=2020870 RepID=UPI003C7304C3
MKEKGVFVITSVYHILIAILLIEQKNLRDSILVIVKLTPNIDTLVEPLKKSPWFTDVKLMMGRSEQKRLLGKFAYKFNRKNVVTLIDKTIDLSGIDNTITDFDFYMASPDSAKQYFLYKYKKSTFFMLEDGTKTYLDLEPNVLKKIGHSILNKPLNNGYDKRFTKVYATNPSGLPPILKEKGALLNWRETFKQLPQEKKELLLDIFLGGNKSVTQTLLNTNKTKSIVVTQPLSEDKKMESEVEKIKIYTDFIESCKTDVVYLKPHPREKTDYHTVFKGQDHVVILEQLFPVELLNGIPGLQFESGFTVFSSSLDHLNVKHKVNLGLDYFREHYAK